MTPCHDRINDFPRVCCVCGIFKNKTLNSAKDGRDYCSDCWEIDWPSTYAEVMERKRLNEVEEEK